MIPLIAAAHLAFLPMTAPAALAALQAKGPMRVEAYYETQLPALVGRSKTASATLVADIGPGAYAVRATAKSEGMSGWFGGYTLDAQSNGSVTEAGTVPRRYDVTNKDGRSNRRLLVDYLPAEVRVLAQPAFGDFGHPPAAPAQRLEGMDPLSAIVNLSLGAGATAENPCGGPIRIFDGKQRYDVKLSFAGRLAYNSAPYKGPAIKCAAQYVEIAGFRAKDEKQRAKEAGNIEWANIILADLPGGLHPPIKIEARTKQKGKLTLQAVKLVYGPAPPSTTVAKR
jgi:hypothetical protein